MTWTDHYEIATARLGVQPDAFWRLTPMEFNTLCGGHVKKQPGGAPITVDEFEEMKTKFPKTIKAGARVH